MKEGDDAKKIRVKRGDIVVSSYKANEIKAGKFLIISAKREPFTGIMILKNFDSQLCSPKSFFKLDNGDFIVFSRVYAIWRDGIRCIVGRLEDRLTDRIAGREESYCAYVERRHDDYSRSLPPKITSIVGGEVEVNRTC